MKCLILFTVYYFKNEIYFTDNTASGTNDEVEHVMVSTTRIVTLNNESISEPSIVVYIASK